MAIDLEFTLGCRVVLRRDIVLIAEVSKKFNLTVDTLRYYERVGLIPPVGRKQNGIRDYQEKDCAWIHLIKKLRDAGVPVEKLIEYVSLCQIGQTTYLARKDILLEQELILTQRIEELIETRDMLRTKINNYESFLLGYENDLIKND